VSERESVVDGRRIERDKRRHSNIVSRAPPFNARRAASFLTDSRCLTLLHFYDDSFRLGLISELPKASFAAYILV
jgi:hypothetical protein